MGKRKAKNMTTTIVLYILLLIVFLVISSLIFRHTVKYRYLSPRFTYVVSFFAFIALVIIIFSVYLLFKVGGSPSTTNFAPSTPSIPSSNGGGLNF